MDSLEWAASVSISCVSTRNLPIFSLFFLSNVRLLLRLLIGVVLIVGAGSTEVSGWYWRWDVGLLFGEQDVAVAVDLLPDGRAVDLFRYVDFAVFTPDHERSIFQRQLQIVGRMSARILEPDWRAREWEREKEKPEMAQCVLQ